MQTKYKQYIRHTFSMLMLFVLGAGMLFTSCEDDDDENGSKVELLSYGPMPVARGGELRFIGNNLDKVSAVVIPNGIEIAASDFTNRSTDMISVTVPQTAVEGLVVLKTSEGDITTKTPIGFSEPISIDEFSPVSVKPGGILTIKGDYLNLVKEIIFTDRVVAVDTVSFEAQSRKEIQVVVPDGAQTGIIGVSDGAEEPNIVYTEGELEVVLPAFAEDGIAPNPVKAGEELTITGSNLDIVRSVKFEGEQIVESDDFVSQTESEIVVVVPAASQDGAVVIVPGSGLEITSATGIEMVVPTITGITPAMLRNGEEITVSGENLDLISNVVFTGDAEGEIAEGGTATQLVVVTPELGLSGAVTFKTLAGKEVVWSDGISFTEPSVTSLNPAAISPNSTLTLTGENLDLVAGIVFAGGIEGEIESQSPTEIQVFVPIGSESGAITMIAKNGAEIETTQSLTVDAPEFSYIPDLPGPEVEINAGEVVTVEVLNGDVLTGVKVNGFSSQFILQGSTLLFLVPSDASGDTDVTLVSSNGEITYTLNVIGSGPIETVIMNEVRDLGSWTGEADGGAFRLYKPSFQGVPAGSILKFYFTASDYNQLQINNANWGSYTTVEITDPTQTSYEMELTQEFLDNILTTSDGWSETAIIVQGEGLVISQVSILTFNESSAGETLWEGEEVLGNWSGNVQLGAALFANAQVGMTLAVTVKDLDASSDYWQIALKDGGWGDIEIASLAAGDTGCEFTIDEAILAEMQSSGVIIQGAFATVTKIELK
ncbi:IPT/TIG domain-containing protein [Marinilabilia sp.]|uniref:IPT/TIG domain-containing protein n=1 Tax=Marinilabilia sp. TaxID=2021252 RepID=UPI0025C17D18|nr:IPT/TIG domain-containing protein [Marinilabilia sp.]